jgi:hypothetical protein
VDAHNRQRSESDPRRIRFNLPPEPFLGPRNAPVVLLSCNPAWVDGCEEQYERPGFRVAALANLTTTGGMPNYVLDDQYEDTQGGLWWRNRLRGLLPANDNDYGALARLVSSVEFHGYWSTQWDPPLVTLPSQHYSFGLVRDAIERDALVILTRAERHWRQAVPELDSHERRGRVVRTVSQRTSILSKRNLRDDGFTKVVAALWA